MLGNSIKKFALNQAFNYIEKDPIKNLTHVMDMVDKFAGSGPQSFPRQRQAIRDAINNEDSTAHGLVVRMMTEMDLGFTETLLSNFFLNASITGWKKQDEYRNKYNCNVPWAILLDPTSACNLHCTGCWAAEYGNKLNLTFEEIDSIIQQGKELGVYFYIYTGGEPLVRKHDLITPLREARRLRRSLCFTNATLIDEQFCRGHAAREELRARHLAWRASRRPPTPAAATAPIRRSCTPWTCCKQPPPALRHLRAATPAPTSSPSAPRRYLDQLVDVGRVLRLVLPLHARGQRRCA